MKRNRLILCLSYFFPLSLFLSCSGLEQYDISKDYNQSQNQVFNKIDIKQEFGRILSVAIAEDESLRSFLKKESLKRFDNDYDILYHKVKDLYVNNNKTFREVILEYIEEEEILEDIESKCPLLTIYVPVLPENTFSPELWDVSSQIPEVAVFNTEKKNVWIYDKSGGIKVWGVEKIPAYPVIVVKECERVCSLGFSESNGFVFEFIDEVFDGSKKELEILRASTIDDKVKTAYNIYKNIDGWQRDYIYYDISPSQIRGAFKYDYQEYITSFKLGTPTMTDISSIIRRISDSSTDPGFNNNWTDGSFEFLVKAKVNASNGIGEEVRKIFSLKADQLFSSTYINKGLYFLRSGMAAKTVSLNIPLINWDLYQYSPSIKISLEEVDPSEVVTTRYETISIFATNFEFTTSGLVKVGLKFGQSNTNTVTNVTESVYNYASDNLGDVIVNFADKVIIDDNSSIRKYYNGTYTITIEPKKVQ